MTTRSSGSSTNLLNFLAYIAVIAIGVALFISWLFKTNGNLSGALTIIANTLAYIVTACYSWRWARYRNIAFVIIWVAAVVLIAVFMILPRI
jgi:hypothetical protein